jgi:hypothetical protein
MHNTGRDTNMDIDLGMGTESAIDKQVPNSGALVLHELFFSVLAFSNLCM